jgi:hypothetical protein
VVTETQSPWYDTVSKEILSARVKLDKKERVRYKPDMLLHCAQKVDKFAPACRTCQRYQGDIKKMTEYLKRVPNMSADDEKDYLKKGNVIGEHLQAQHKLNLEGKYFGWGAVIGAAIGGMTGWAAGDFLYITLPVGLGIGCLIGWLFEKKARNEGKTL